MAEQKITVGISSCLLGQAVRYDGTDKLCKYIVDALGEIFEFRAFCPEVAGGMGTPRPPIQLVRIDHEIHALGVEDPGMDVTDALLTCTQQAVKECAELSGYIFKARSPSCGLSSVAVYDEQGATQETTSGLFAAGIIKQYPSLPVEDEERLADPEVRKDFVRRVRDYHLQQANN